MKDLVTNIAKALVDKPEEVVVTVIEGEQTSVIELKVAKESKDAQRRLSERYSMQPPRKCTSDSFWSLLSKIPRPQGRVFHFLFLFPKK